MLKIRQLQKKKQEEAEALARANSSTPPGEPQVGKSDVNAKVTAAQIRLQKDITELDLPKTIAITFPDPNDFFNFFLQISPQQGYYKGGKFRFKIEINNNFPMEPPKIKCLNKIYHPNIDAAGNICLNILREDWSPVLNLNSILIGLNFLFLEPNPNDPLNKEAANVLVREKEQFRRNVGMAMRGGYVEGEYYDNVL
ncbi:NEDD8-conjugating enzyme UBC12 [Suhomyces tanzawaensis NRRL Y-17324]|uniref:NEDD8-conjugating enzyme UBC12 n=1 Tax=Suhomyces tanzawaensis NRRL Y-17324 TaxID=984487 RepID=A0A1E4SPP0_9ASCO|nr:NEDD8-conjugating enzyme UBC12 [Suhomyces tanzawaensis NRRL Y-17324]ODV81491.1 NEDD8-conjugating enzyme UBC12 [Suhomyces tanzawaensis NRRL Y-17324]